MPRISLWNNGRKGADYKFTDRTVSEFFGASGTAVYVHLYQGVHDQSGSPTPAATQVTSIQDVLYLENRDRKYSQDVYELRGCYQIQNVDFDMRQFGIFLANDTIFIEFHLNDMISLLGRKLMNGDVLELPHLRDEDLLNGGRPASKFYVVEDANRAEDGYSQTWFAHIWRVRVSPMTNAQEYADVLEKETFDPFGLGSGETLEEVLGTVALDMSINEAVIEQAIESVKDRNFETSHFYVVPGSEQTNQNPWIFSGDGIPPNGATLAGSGHAYPDQPARGDYFLRTDYSPPTLYRFMDGVWRRQEISYRMGKYSAASRLLEDFLNNTKTVTHEDGTVASERQALSQAVKPRADW